MAVPCPVLTLLKHIPQLLLNLKLFLKRDSLRGDRGEVGLDPSKEVLGLLELLLGVAPGVVVLHSSILGLSGTAAAESDDVDGFVLQRKLRDCRRGVEGLLPPEKKLSLVQLLGLGLGLGLVLRRPFCCFSETLESGESRETVVQKALLHPVPISTGTQTTESYHFFFF